MLKELQELIKQLEAEKEKAERNAEKYEQIPHMNGVESGQAKAFSFVIQKLNLLLSQHFNSGR